MSVVMFDTEELANVASYLATRDSEHQQVAEWLAAYSVGNAVAYSRQYREGVEPVSAAAILAALNPRRYNRAAAKGTLRLLRYNGVTNAGRETALPGYHEALAGLMALAFERAMSEQDAARDAA